MKLKIYSIIAFIILMGAVSCSEDYLNTSPTDAVDSKTAFATTGSAYTVLNGIHRAMFMQYSNQNECGQQSVMIDMDMLGEDLVMTTAGNGWFNGIYQWIDLRNANSSTNYFIYRFYYKIIANANLILSNIDKAEGTSADKRLIKGQAFAYRAWAHFMLVQIFAKRYDYADGAANNQLGVPLMVTNTIEGLPRETVKNVYIQIKSDLDSAETNIAGYNRGSVTDASVKSQINPNVVYGIKARVALTTGDWTTAVNYAQKARSGYALMSATDYTSGFNNAANAEWIWGSQVISDQTNYFYSFFAYMSANFSSTNIRTDPKAINSLLYKKIPKTDIRKSLWDSTGKATTFPNGKVIPSNFAKYPYFNFKFLVADASSSVADIPYMRSSEMYLIEAEANARAGNDAAAQTSLFTLVSKRDPSYVKSTKTGAALIDEILTQRRIELWGEGFRFTDLKRLDLPLNRAGANHSPSLCRILTVSAGDVQWQFLIPQAEINANPSLGGQQNP